MKREEIIGILLKLQEEIDYAYDLVCSNRKEFDTKEVDNLLETLDIEIMEALDEKQTY